MTQRQIKLVENYIQRQVKNELSKKNRLTEASRKLFPNDLRPGKTYEMGYRTHKWNSTFVKWTLDPSGPRMTFKDEDGDTWEAYMYDGFMAVGSSADKLIIYREV